ncbi:MAG: elongation factor 4 [Candidatus Kerfeldbacteria bacterium]|nr:elongation factor 4 [Candidatus Kerfeldbacteria bacterium]
MTSLGKIRNFCIIAHIDHGKSTLADRFLERTDTVPRRAMRDQYLDQMDIERERGITVKLAPVRMDWRGYQLNLIDTPGHVDFAYEVSRSLASVEGAVLVVDASQGLQAQTLANLEAARRAGLAIIPVVNKIDLPNADLPRVKTELAQLLQIDQRSIIAASAKQGHGIEAILERIITDVPPPAGRPEQPLRARIFDSTFDPYQGVVAYVRVVDGRIAPSMNIQFLGRQATSTVQAVGQFHPQLVPTSTLTAGEIGYVVTGLKTVVEARVGDTIAPAGIRLDPLTGYQPVTPMVFAGLFPADGHDLPRLRQGLEKLRLNDAAITFEPEHSPALGAGFRGGFLGLLHLDIVRERLAREYQVPITITTPSVAYHVWTRGAQHPLIIRGPLELPDAATIEQIEEPVVKLDVLTPSQFIGPVLETVRPYRGQFLSLGYLTPDRAVLHFSVPLASILVDFYDHIKSVSAGYATVSYALSGYRAAELVRLDILIAGQRFEALSTMVYQDQQYPTGRKAVETLKSLLPRQLFEVKIQAVVGGTIVAAATVPARRKDVTAKLYGGDVTRKRKLLAKQKRGKQRLRAFGKVDLPPSAYLAVLKH